ncbi:methionyl-tRNA formyltransferase [Photobacterium lipolyticum]|uniref:Uncharacterized protein n=1 Tax=Photobacterium lipolyticum TaxID=266810 RepID=A0A2T3MZ73_9GAMM|nr:formyltransferase family protein [Photobacterium lipolyticum]PSW05261.1 hypothetical protein C9I89_10820 [Photobacterium lipolyticum]
MDNNAKTQETEYKNKVSMVTSNYGSLPVILWLRQQGYLNGVLLYGVKGQELAQFEAQLDAFSIPVAYVENDDKKAVEYLDSWQTELLIVFNCGKILSETVFDFATYGTVNLHAAGLPHYRGPHPVYWQLRNGEKQLLLTAHRVIQEIDSGDILAQYPIGISDFDTHQTLYGKVIQHMPLLLEQLFALDLNRNKTPGLKQASAPANKAPRVSQSDLNINWYLTSVKALCDQVRAGNPIYGGAILTLGGASAQLLQVSAAVMPTYGAKPGTIIHISPERGVYVALKESAVRLDIVANSEGVFDGYRFSQVVGLKTGMKFN